MKRRLTPKARAWKGWFPLARAWLLGAGVAGCSLLPFNLPKVPGVSDPNAGSNPKALREINDELELRLASPNKSPSNERRPTIEVLAKGFVNGIEVQIFADELCATAPLGTHRVENGVEAGATDAPNESVVPYPVALDELNEGRYRVYARAQFRNPTGFVVKSACSVKFVDYVVDTTPPAAATTNVWREGSHSNQSTLGAEWVPSADADVESQSLLVYPDATCAASTPVPTSVASKTAGDQDISVGADGAYSFRVRTLDEAGNESLSACSASILVDFQPPTPATPLAWEESDPHAGTTITASWTPSTSSDLAAQSAQFYSGAGCNAVFGAPVGLASASTNSHAISGVNGQSYSYRIVSMDASGNASTSSCSPAIRVDTSAPNAATTLAWNGDASPKNSTSLTASWTKSNSSDLASQSIQFYAGATCATASGTAIALTHTATTRAFTGTNGSTYSFRVTSTDFAGNGTVSACSSAMTIDTTGPNAATALAWNGDASPKKSTSLTASWTKSNSSDLASQNFQLYANASCTTSVGSPTALAASAETHSLTGTNGGLYYYAIHSIDAAGNSTASGCSPLMAVDTTAPNAAHTLAWNGDASPKNSTSLTASWTKSNSSDLASQSIQFYADATCSTASGAAVALASSATTRVFTGTDGTTYTYKVTSLDDAGNSTESACSPSMRVDTTAPNAATTIGWVEASPTGDLNVTASWTPSTSGDLASQSIQFYADATCSTASGGALSRSAAASSEALAGTAGTIFSYRVTSIDTAGNSSASACSSPMEFDSGPPVNATTLAWGETSPHDATNVTATWTPSASSDLASQSIQFYADATCSAASGAAIALSDSAATQSFSGADGGVYAYTITSIDTANNTSTSSCSASMRIDTTPPLAATAIAWSETSPHNATGVTASWTLSASGDLASQSIQFYADASCSATSGSAISLTNAVATRAFTGVNGSTYTYKVTSIDAAGNSTASPCSSSMLIDTSAPLAATSLAWSETSPHDATNVTASWTPSLSTDLASQSIQFYADASCSATSGSAISLSGVAATRAFTGVNGSTYTYKVTSTDAAGNSTASPCSAPMLIDTSAPLAATGLAWSETSPHDATGVTAAWTPSSSLDLASQSIQFYADASCSATSGSAISLASSATTRAFTGADGGAYTYKVTSIDAAGNSTESSCSSAMRIDTTAPNAATVIAWSETSPHDATSVTATWTPSSSLDLASQSIQFYADGTCGTTSGLPLPLTSALSSQSFTGTDGGTYSFRVTSIDTADNSTASSCSGAMLIDTSAPLAATSLAWTETSPFSGTTVHAAWTKSSSGDLSAQAIQFYSDASCTATTGAAIALGASDQSYAFTGSSGSTYTYKVASKDAAGHSTDSGCSSAMHLDTDGPDAALSLGWTQASPHNSTSVTASWTRSTASDLASQSIQFYADASCSATSGSAISLASSANTRAFTGSNGSTSTYKVTSTDTAGNSTVSSCSSSMLIDTTAPNAATVLAWNGDTSPKNSTSLTASWTKSSSGDLSAQRIQFYSDASCSTSSGAAIDLDANATTRAFTGADGGTYAFRVTSFDAATNSSVSACSSAMRVDTSPPPTPVLAMASGYDNPSSQTTPSFAVTLTGSVNFTDGDVVTLHEAGDATCSGSQRATASISGGATASSTLTTNSALSTHAVYNYRAKVTDAAGNSSCSSALAYTFRPLAPTTLARHSPTTLYGNNPKPTIRVSGGGTLNGRLVRLYGDDACSQQIAEGTAGAGDSADLTPPTNLAPGPYTFYASVRSGSIWSACSTGTVAYILDTTPPATPLITLSSPASSPNTVAKPAFRVALDGGGSFESADRITLHRVDGCGDTAVGVTEATTGYSATHAIFTLASNLSEGRHDFWAKVQDEAGNFACSVPLPGGDNHLGSVKLLLALDGADGSTTFTDAVGGKSPTANGDARIRTAQSRFGGASAYFDGDGDFVEIPHSADFDLSSTFTVETWIRPETGATDRYVAGNRTAGYNWVGWAMWLNSSNKIAFMTQNHNTVASSTTLSMGQWYHIAVTGDGATVRLFVNGTLEDSIASTDANATNPGWALRIGGLANYYAADLGWVGYIDDFRITKGVARHTANFAAPTSAYPTGPSGSVQYHYDNTAPTWADSLSLAAASSTSTTAAPEANFAANAMDGANGSGIATVGYEYAVGTGMADGALVDVKAWTPVAEGPFTASGLTLTPGMTYYVHLRAIDNVGLKSAIGSEAWVVVAAPSISYAGALGTSGLWGQMMIVSPTSFSTGGVPIKECTSSPTLPSGLSLNGTTCVISGTPDALAASGSYTITVKNDYDLTASASVTLAVAANVPRVSFTGASGTSGAVGSPMSINPTALEPRGASITACTSTPALPAGLSPDPTTCAITGTPTALASGNYVIRATNSVGQSASTSEATIAISIVAGPPALSYASSNGNGDTGSAMSVSPSTFATNGAATTCAAQTALPAGLSVNNSCIISGTPTAGVTNGSYTIRATNSAGSTDATVVLNICAPTTISATTTLTNGYAACNLIVTGASTTVTVPSANDIDVAKLTIQSSGTVVLDRNETFQNVVVTSGTLTATGYANTYSGGTWSTTPDAGNGKLKFTVTDTLSVGATGIVHMDAKGYLGGQYASAPGRGGWYGSPPVAAAGNGGTPGGAGTAYASWQFGGGGAYATAAGTSSSSHEGGLPFVSNDFVTAEYLGSGGGAGYGDPGSPGDANDNGGAGGGAVVVTAARVTVASGGRISARGETRGCGNHCAGGGGSGGTVILNANLFSNAGTISVAGGTARDTGSGSRGRIYIPTTALKNGTNDITLSNYVGLNLRFLNGESVGTLTLGASNEIEVTEASGTYSITSLVMNGASNTLFLNAPLTVGSATLTNGTLTAEAFPNIFDATTGAWSRSVGPGVGQLKFTVTGALTVGAAGVITMSGKGYPGGTSARPLGGSPNGRGGTTLSASPNGSGGGGGVSSGYFGGGGSYATTGGYFGTSNYVYLPWTSPADFGHAQNATTTYGASDYTTALYLGSGGGFGHTTQAGGAGGGAIEINAGSITLSAATSQIVARGLAAGTYGGAGSGGTIVLNTTAFSNANGGPISVSGGATVGNSNAGGYGRLYIPPSAVRDGSDNVTLNGFQGYEYRLASGESINTLAIGPNSDVFLSADGDTTNAVPARISTLSVSGTAAKLTLQQGFRVGTANITNGTLTAPAYANSFDGSGNWTTTPGIGNGQLRLWVNGNLNVGATGRIDMNEKGFAGGTTSRPQGGSSTGRGGTTLSASPNGGGGGGGVSAGYFGGGGSYGTQGGYSGNAGNTVLTRASYGEIGHARNGDPYGDSDFTTVTSPYLGSGGGYGHTTQNGGSGGGAIEIDASAINVANGGLISSAGMRAGFYAGSGSGGTIILNTSALTVTSGGLVSVAGGLNSSNHGWSNNGGYGRLHVTPSAIRDGSSNVAFTGLQGLRYRIPSGTNLGTLTVGSLADVFLTADGDSTSVARASSISISSGARLNLEQAFRFGAASISGTLTSPGYANTFDGSGNWTTSPDAGNGQLKVAVNGTFAVAATGRVDMDYKGFFGGSSTRGSGGSVGGRGPAGISSTANGGGGSGGSQSGLFGGGGSYGSMSGFSHSATVANGRPYGAADFASALYLGSGGGFGHVNQNGGPGGGGISVSATTISLASGAQILTRGLPSGAYGGSGSGGTIVLSATTLSDAGASILASGGQNTGGASYTNHGGNGRLQVTYDSCGGTVCPHVSAPANYVPSVPTSHCSLSGSTYVCRGVSDSADRPTTLARQTPVSSPDASRQPVVRVSGGLSAVQGAIARLYKDSSCSSGQLVGTATVGASGYADVQTVSLADGAYVFYATFTKQSAAESACSTASASYVVSNAAASAPTLALTTPAVSPGNQSAPAFTATLASGSFAIDEVLTLHEGANCAAAAVSTPSTPGAVASALVTRAGAMAEGLQDFRVKVTTAAGHTSCTSAVAYRYDNTPPLLTTTPSVVVNPSNLLNQTPSIYLDSSGASDAGSGVAAIEYAFGQDPNGGTNIVSWTTYPDEPFVIYGLSLVDGQRYYVHMRAKDNVGLISSLRTTSFVVDTTAPDAVTVAAAFAAGAKWNDWLKNDGAGGDIYANLGNACVGTENSATACFHAGLMRKVTLSAETSCAGLEAHDNLGAFEWSCRVESGQAVVYSTAFKAGKSLSDLIDFATPDWKTNYVTIVGGSAAPSYASTAAKWWTNTVSALPDNSGSTSSSLASAGTIYVLASTRETGGYRLAANGVGLVVKPGETLRWNNSSTAVSGCSYRSVVCVSSHFFTWIEGSFHGGLSTNKASYGVQLRTTRFNAGGPITTQYATTAGIWIDTSHYNRFGDIIASNNGGRGLFVDAALGNTFGNVTVNENTGTGVNAGLLIQLASNGNTFGNITAWKNSSHGIYFYSTDSLDFTAGTITATENTGDGLNILGQEVTYTTSAGERLYTGLRTAPEYNHSIGDIVANDNGGYGVYAYGTDNSKFGNVEALRNGSSGIYLYAAVNNSFGNIKANANRGTSNSGGLALALASDLNSFGNVEAKQNHAGGIYSFSTDSLDLTFGNVTASNNGSVTANGGITVSAAETRRRAANDYNWVMGTIEANDNRGFGLNLEGADNCKFGDVTANLNTQSGVYLNQATRNEFGNVTANENKGTSNYSGIGIYYSSNDNRFGDIVVRENASYGLYSFSTASNNLVFGNVTAVKNKAGGGVYFSAGSGLRLGNIVSTDNVGEGVRFSLANNSKFGNITSTGNTQTQIYIDGTVLQNLEFGDLIANGSATYNTHGFYMPASTSATNIRIKSIVSSNNNYYGTYVGNATDFTVTDYMISSNNGYIGTAFANLTRGALSNVLASGNGNVGFTITAGANTTLRNVSTLNNAGYGLSLGTVSNFDVHNVTSTGNTHGVYIASGTTNRFTGSLQMGGNTSANCLTAGTNPGLVTSTCTSTGTDGSSGYGTNLSTAVLRTGRNLASTFVGSISAPGDESNVSDGGSGLGFGFAEWSQYFDYFNFDNAFRNWGRRDTASSSPLVSTNRGACAAGGICQIYDWSLSKDDMILLNRSGNGTNVNNGSSMTSNGSYSTGDNTFGAGQACPVQTLGDQALESRPFAASSTIYGANLSLRNAFVSEGSTTSCYGGDTNGNGVVDGGETWTYGSACVQRYLAGAIEIYGETFFKTVSTDRAGLEVLGDTTSDTTGLCTVETCNLGAEVAGDNLGDDDGVCEAGEVCYWGDEDGVCEVGEACRVGDDDGLCESGEDCFYAPNFGPYQGHFPTTGSTPILKDAANQCTWSSNGGTISGVQMYGYPKNGR